MRATTWMSLKGIALNEISWSHTDRYSGWGRQGENEQLSLNG